MPGHGTRGGLGRQALKAGHSELAHWRSFKVKGSLVLTTQTLQIRAALQTVRHLPPHVRSAGWAGEHASVRTNELVRTALSAVPPLLGRHLAACQQECPAAELLLPV